MNAPDLASLLGVEAVESGQERSIAVGVVGGGRGVEGTGDDGS